MKTEILKYPNKNLNKISKKVSDEEGLKIAKKLLKYVGNNNGLSAIQLGITATVFVFNTNKINPIPKFQIVINPKIISHGREKCVCIEGCLSCPESELVKRWKKVVVRYYDGVKSVREDLTGSSAQIFQHEFDHLQGILICDKNNKNVVK
jgi:peptide deformylase